MNIARPPTKVFLHFHHLPNERVQAIWVSRGASTDMYKSKPCATHDEATALARKWLARQTHIIESAS